MERWNGKINGGYFPLRGDGTLDWENKRRLFYLERKIECWNGKKTRITFPWEEMVLWNGKINGGYFTLRRDGALE